MTDLFHMTNHVTRGKRSERVQDHVNFYMIIYDT